MIDTPSESSIDKPVANISYKDKKRKQTTEDIKLLHKKKRADNSSDEVTSTNNKIIIATKSENKGNDDKKKIEINKGEKDKMEESEIFKSLTTTEEDSEEYTNFIKPKNKKIQ